MKITVIGQSVDERTGGGLLLSSVVNALKDEGHTISIWSSDINLPRNKVSLIKKIWKVREDLADSDFVHAFDLYPYAIIAYLASLGTKTKMVVTLIGTGSVQKIQSFFWRVILGVVLRGVSAVTSISRFIGEEVRVHYPWMQYVVINPGVNLGEWKEKEVTRPEMIPDGLRYILSVGSMKKRKGHDVLIKAFAGISKKENISLVIVSNPKQGPEYFKELKALVFELGVSDRVIFISDISVEEKRWLFKNCVMFALASQTVYGDTEGFGIVFLEAAANGKVSVGSARTGAEDAILDGASGYLVDPADDVNAWTTTMSRVLSENDRRATMSVESYKWAEKNERSLMTQKYVELYKKLQG